MRSSFELRVKFIWTSYKFHMNKSDCISYEILKLIRSSYELNFIWSSYEVHNKLLRRSHKFHVKLCIYDFIWTSYDWASRSIVHRHPGLYSISQEICTRFLLCCALLWLYIDFPISTRLTSLALWQSNDCPSAGKATLMNMEKYFIWNHYERLHNHNKAKHNKTVCIFLGIYCTCIMKYYHTLNTTSPVHQSTIPWIIAWIKRAFGWRLKWISIRSAKCRMMVKQWMTMTLPLPRWNRSMTNVCFWHVTG